MRRTWRIHHGCGTELFSGDEDALKRRCTQIALSVQNRGATVTVEEVVGHAAQRAAAQWRRDYSRLDRIAFFQKYGHWSRDDAGGGEGDATGVRPRFWLWPGMQWRTSSPPSARRPDAS
jgi:hypothetical protein